MTTAVAAEPCVRVWVDHLGCTHELEPSEHNRTLCDLNAGDSHALIPRVCRDCIRTHLARFDVPEVSDDH